MELVERYLPDYSMHILQKEILVICFEYLVETKPTLNDGFETYFNEIKEGPYLYKLPVLQYVENGYYINNKQHGKITGCYSYHSYNFRVYIFYNKGSKEKHMFTDNMVDQIIYYKEDKHYGFHKTNMANKCFTYNLYNTTGKIIFTWTFDYWIKKVI